MAEGMGIGGAQGVQASSALAGANTIASAAADVASSNAATKTPEQQQAIANATSYTAQPATGPQVPGMSRVVQRLLEQNATVYAPGLAKIPLPPRPEEVVRQAPKKPAGAMVAPRTLDAGLSPLAPGSLADARASVDGLGTPPDDSGEGNVVANAADGAYKMPSRHGLVMYTTTGTGERAYLTQDRWLHIRENHMDPEPAQRGKRTTTYWPTRHAVEGPSMNDGQVLGVITATTQRGTLKNEVRDTRMAEYPLPAEQAAEYGVSEAKVSMAPDGMILSAYPGAGTNVLAVYEISGEDQAALAAAQATTFEQQASDERMFQTNVAATTFGA
ncbi:MAG: hypothetical protein JWM90_2295 [Thermoleophilia bacterium]|nr:hypothetical protein [Thermoleophilia bacterium]